MTTPAACPSLAGGEPPSYRRAVMLGTIHSPRLSLRDVTLDDAPAFFELDRDAEVMRFLGLSRSGRARFEAEDVELYRVAAV
jgi:RimJ/RimL family protein N-acetyltransferase